MDGSNRQRGSLNAFGSWNRVGRFSGPVRIVPSLVVSCPTSFTTSHTESGAPLSVWSGPTHRPWSGGVSAPKSWSLVRSFSPSKAFVTDPLPLAAGPAETVGAPAPVACAAGLAPPGDLVPVSALGTWAFSIAGFGVTGLNPATPFAEAASRGDWPVVLNIGAELAAAGLSVAA